MNDDLHRRAAEGCAERISLHALFVATAALKPVAAGSKASATTTSIPGMPGTFPVLRSASQRAGNAAALCARIQNPDRLRTVAA